jgi:hypothetical protein
MHSLAALVQTTLLSEPFSLDTSSPFVVGAAS